jgi:hypothetical protein
MKQAALLLMACPLKNCHSSRSRETTMNFGDMFLLRGNLLLQTCWMKQIPRFEFATKPTSKGSVFRWIRRGGLPRIKSRSHPTRAFSQHFRQPVQPLRVICDCGGIGLCRAQSRNSGSAVAIRC